MLVRAFPHIVTACLAVGITLFIQMVLFNSGPAILPPQRPTAPPTSVAQPIATTQPSPVVTPPQPDERVLSQEIIDLRARLNEVWSGMYIARAAGQIADAEIALRSNDTTEVERVLVAVDTSLGLAYDRSDDRTKGPIGEFRSQVGQVRDDLYLRPENLDQRLRLLRQRMLSLVEEP